MKKKLTAILVCVLLVVAALAGCAGGDTANVQAQPAGAADQTPAPETAAQATAQPEASAPGAAVTDMVGNTVEVGPAERIISLTPAGTEIVYALGMGDKLVGVDAFSNYPEETKALEVVGDYNGPDVEKVVGLEPDIVLAGNTLQQDAIDNLNNLGIKVACVEATTFDQIPQSYQLVGTLLGKEAEAAQLTGSLQQAIAAAQENAPAEPKTVYYAMSYGEAGNWTSGPGSFINDMIALAGGTPAVQGEGLPPWVEYPVEDLVASGPDIILMDGSMGAVGDLAQQTGYKELDAVKNGNVYGINADIFTRPGPRVAEALAELSKILNEA